MTMRKSRALFIDIVRTLVVGLAAIGSVVLLLLLAGTFLFTAATSPTDPDEQYLPLFTLSLLAGTASTLIIAWSLYLGWFQRLHREVKSLLLLTTFASLIVVAGIAIVSSGPT